MSKLEDGFGVVISFAEDADVKLYQTETTPPGIKGGGGHDTSTMENTAWRTKAVGTLLELTDASFVAAYDPAVYTEIIALINTPQLITVTFPDGATVAFYGSLDTFTPNGAKEHDMPLADVTIVPTMVNPATGAETAPAVTAAT